MYENWLKVVRTMQVAMQTKTLIKLCEDSESDDKESKPSSSQTLIVSLVDRLKSPNPAEILQKQRAKNNALVIFVFSVEQCENNWGIRDVSRE